MKLIPWDKYKTLEVTIPGRPVPAVRTTQKQKFVCPRYKKYQEYKNTIKVRTFGEVWENYEKFFSLDCPVYISCDIYVKGGKVGDIDNYLKSCLDGLQLSTLIKNDRQVKSVQAEIVEVDTKEEERMEIKVNWLEE